MNPPTTTKRTTRDRCLALALASLIALVVIATTAPEVEAAATSGLILQQSKHSGDYNNLENLISELLDDAGNRLKKSKLSSMRQVKQTLRFGRSDPLMAPPFKDAGYELAGDLGDE